MTTTALDTCVKHGKPIITSAGYCEDCLNPKRYDHNSAQQQVVFERNDTLNEPKDPLPDAYKLVRMREVTPQDEQDRLDAVEYRRLKERLLEDEWRELMDL